MDVLRLLGSQSLLGSHDQFRADFYVLGELCLHLGMGRGDFENLAEDVNDSEADFLGGKGGRNESVDQAHFQQVVSEGVGIFCLC